MTKLILTVNTFKKYKLTSEWLANLFLIVWTAVNHNDEYTKYRTIIRYYNDITIQPSKSIC
jgi:hypothetical protein